MRKFIFFSPSTQGFTLPAILIVSVVLMTIGLSLMQSTASVRDNLDSQYFERLNSEAAEAGIAYANYCLSTSGFTQTWGPVNGKPNLTQKTDCNGDPIAAVPSYLMTQGTYRTGFSVGDLETRSDGAIIFSSTGTFEQTRGNTSSIARSSTSNLKQVVRWKTYLPSVSGSGSYKTCAVVSNEAYCWGRNSVVNASDDQRGNLGNGTTTDSLVPVKVVQAPGVLAGKVVDDVEPAQYHVCALAAGKVYCWGRNHLGQLGQNSTSAFSSVPVEVGGALSGKTVTNIHTSGNATCAISEGKIYCWGGNDYGVVGIGSAATTVLTPTLVSTTNLGASYTATALSTSGSRSYTMCAIVAGKAWCWGSNGDGQIGIGTNGAAVTVPTKVNDTGALAGKTVTSISQDGAANKTHVCAVADGALYCWGENSLGQLGRAVGNFSDSYVPVAVKASVSGDALYGKTVTDVAAGLYHTCALAAGKAYCWGENINGQLGTGNETDYQVPAAVKANAVGDRLYNKTVTSVSAGGNRGCVLAGYEASCWGLNGDGQLGDGTTISRNAPTESVYLRPKAPVFVF